MIDTQVLKNKILELAISGKLTTQLSQDGHADDLYEQIQKEKRSISKKSNVSTPASDIEDETIYCELPANWKWVRLGSIVSVFGGKRIPAGRSLSLENTGHKYIRVSEMKDFSVNAESIRYVPEDIYPSISRYIINSSDVYITVAGTIGRVGIVPDELDGANLTENADRLVFTLLNKYWLMYCLSTSFIQKQIKMVTTQVAQPKLSIKRIEALVIPLPPLAEQKRIADIIDKAFVLIDSIECNQKLYKLNKESLKAGIIDLGVSGKLTKRLPDDGTAEEFYSLIQTEKQRLIKEKKIKKDKPLLDIDDSELFGTCPQEWKMVRLGEVIHLQSGQDLTSDLYSDEEVGIPYLTGASNFNDNGDLIINRWTNAPKSLAYRNDVLLSVKGTVGKLKILDYDSVHIARQIMAIRGILIDKDYLKYYLESQLGKIKRASKGLIPGIERSDIRNMIIALPPLKEQKRIVIAISSAIELLQSENV